MPATHATLALIVILNSAGGSIESAPSNMPAPDCLAAMRAIWAIPAETVAYDEFGAVPAVDAYCADPATVEAP